MRQFITRYHDKIRGVLSGFDRVLFRGHLTSLWYEKGLRHFLAAQGVLLKHFGPFVQAVTQMLRQASVEVAEKASVPVIYLESSKTRKEDVIRRLLKERPIDHGLIAILSCVEPCVSWQIYRSREEQTQKPQLRWRKCLHLYHYFLDEDFGLMHVRLQTWMPYTVQVCVNGREWLARQLDRAGIGYTKIDNKFPDLDDVDAAQKLMNRLVRLPWTKVLDAFALKSNPALATIQDHARGRYYWSAHQSEWATDVMFKRQENVTALFPVLARHAISDFSTTDVLRFLGKKPHPRFQGEVTSDYKVRQEGLRIRHSVGFNGMKMYDGPKIIRGENTFQRPAEFKVRRRAHGKPKSPRILRPLRKGVADIQARARIGQAINNRYFDALAAADTDKTVQQILSAVLKPADAGGRRVRALRPWSSPDIEVLRAIGHGEFLTNGFRNRDLVAILYPALPDEKQERRRASGRISRLLRILRAHGLIRRVEHSYRYHVTNRARQIITAVIATSEASLSKLRRSA
jgi:hypothetical protein